MLDQSVKKCSVSVSKAKDVKCRHVVEHSSRESCGQSHSSSTFGSVGDPDRMAPSASGYKTRLFYNSNVKPRDIEAILANRGKKNKKLIAKKVVKSMIFTGGNSARPDVVIPLEGKDSLENDCKTLKTLILTLKTQLVWQIVNMRVATPCSPQGG